MKRSIWEKSRNTRSLPLKNTIEAFKFPLVLVVSDDVDTKQKALQEDFEGTVCWIHYRR